MRFIGYLCICSALAACAQAPATVPSHSVGMPNPASVYCTQQGGRVELPAGICHLPSGTQLDEWDLYYKDHPRPLAKP